MKDRRQHPFGIDEAKFATQKLVTYILLFIFAATVANVFMTNDQSERSMLLQTVINLTLLAVGYWLGSSKGAAESNATIKQMTQDVVVKQPEEKKP